MASCTCTKKTVSYMDSPLESLPSMAPRTRDSNLEVAGRMFRSMRIL